MRASCRGASGLAVLTALAVVCLGLAAGACSEPPPDDSPDPCGVLTTECPYCTQPGPKQTCETASVSGDDVQCTVALDDSQVIADCVVPPDGGARNADAADAAPLSTCDPSVVSGDAGCSCAEPCATSCPAGGCDITCAPGGTCTPTCEGGGCEIHCPAGATCEASCAGGRCVLDCQPGSSCASSCGGGGCSFQCSVGAICNDTCAATPACVGP